jgi:hypothetical protein
MEEVVAQRVIQELTQENLELKEKLARLTPVYEMEKLYSIYYDDMIVTAQYVEKDTFEVLYLPDTPLLDVSEVHVIKRLN